MYYPRSFEIRMKFVDVATKHMTDMTSSFKTKTGKFVNDIQSDLKQSKPILKNTTMDTRTTEADDPQAYREETRVAQYGKKIIKN